MLARKKKKTVGIVRQGAGIVSRGSSPHARLRMLALVALRPLNTLFGPCMHMEYILSRVTNVRTDKQTDGLLVEIAKESLRIKKRI